MKKKEIISKNLIITLLLCTTIISIGIITLFFYFHFTDNKLPPDYDSISTEEYIEPLPDNDEAKMESEDGGGAVSLSFTNEITVDLTSKTAHLYFANPHKSNHSIILRIVIQNTPIIQSGIIAPGNQIQKLSLTSDTANKLSKGIYKGHYEIHYYHPETGEQAAVNTQIPVTISVQ